MNAVSSWQQMTYRLDLHGSLTPLVPGSMLYAAIDEYTVYVGEEIAAPFESLE